MGYEGSSKAICFCGWFMLLIMSRAPQDALPVAAPILAQTGQRSCAVAVPCGADGPASDDRVLPSLGSASVEAVCCIPRTGKRSLQSSQAIASTIGAAMKEITKHRVMSRLQCIGFIILGD